MLFEAIEIINKLFTGKVVRHHGKHFTLESAKLYTRPEEPVPIYVATAGPVNAKRTGRLADGMITVGAADEKIGMLWGKFDEGCARGRQGSDGMPKLLQIHVCWAPTERRRLDNAMREWPNGGMPFPKQDIKNPEDFAAMAKLVRPEDFTNRVPDLAPTSTAHGARSSTTSTWASTRSTSTTSGATRPSSSRSSGARCCPACASADRPRRCVRAPQSGAVDEWSVQGMGAGAPGR